MENKQNVKFSDLGLNEKVIKAIDDMGFEEPSRIQAEIIPVLLQGFDAIGQAQTGTGKTLAFGAPILSKFEKKENNIYAIILAPTRELAIQVNDELVRLAKYIKVKTLPVYGGQPIERQIRALKNGIDIIVGTPGRVLDLIRRNIIDLSSIKFLVLDEADEMLDMGFIDDIEEIIKNANKDRQTMLFSATMPDEIKKLSKRYMKDDRKHISIVKNTMTVSTVSQYYYEVKQNNRFESFCRILDVEEPSSAIIFCKTKKGVDELVEAMQTRGYSVEGMHGDMSQNQRLNTLKKFKEGNLEFLVATDVAARGIDVENVTHVINYDLPQDIESYVHRIGRTGRAKKEGIAYSLVTPREYMTLKQIEKVTKSKIKRKEIPTIDDIFQAKFRNILDRIKETLEEDEYKRFVPLATELDDDYNLVDVAAALMNILYNKEISYEYTENNISVETGFIRLFLTVGRIDKINPKSILQFFNENAGINKEDIGNIDIFEKFTFVDVNERAVDIIIKKCNGKKISGRKVNVEISRPKK
ncbi:ATP-dependent RNA helicase DeaD [Clostridium sp. USBA 49]|jgi:ATP-dependent RNA helicase DeaD|uniref:DEAD/DEAH box helicase n=1 Tax=Clostridium TaxID=1485 RepID=UPI000999ED12|nr:MULTISPECIES: DEAD/DEAH box helicase [Clostridium]SKA86023.1 ATP-dependent RNA helicase DeaD [Clostridium sp. USBA 49]